MKLTFLLLLLLVIGFAPSRGPVPLLNRSTPQQTSTAGPVRMIRFVLSPDGIYPRQMQVDHGLLNLAVEDQTEGSAGLLIESVLGDQRTRVTQVSRVENHRRGRALVRLTPGRYLVSDATRPTHQAELIVNP